MGRRILVVIGIVWLPLMLIRLWLWPAHFMELLLDYRLVARELIAAPAFVLAEPIMESRFRMLLDHIRNSRLLVGPDLARMDEILAGLRLRDSYLPEFVILLGIIAHTVTSYKFVGEQSIGDLAFQSPTGIHLTPAGWYAMVISAPFTQFLAGVVLWRWLLWTIFAFRLSRLNLRLVPSHPDENGGLGFLSISTRAFVPSSFAISTVIGASFRNDILNHGKHLVNFKGPAIAFVVIIFGIALFHRFSLCPSYCHCAAKGSSNTPLSGRCKAPLFMRNGSFMGTNTKPT